MSEEHYICWMANNSCGDSGIGADDVLVQPWMYVLVVPCNEDCWLEVLALGVIDGFQVLDIAFGVV